MKKYPVFIFMMVLTLLTFGCSSSKKTIESEPGKVPVTFPPSEKKVKKEKTRKPEDTITVRQEKLVETPETPVPKQKYFVIIGSFRYPENVKKYMQQIRDEGFLPFILRNEEGLYRVAVFSYDDEMRAREKVHAIWKTFPRHGDTWLLVKEK